VWHPVELPSSPHGYRAAPRGQSYAGPSTVASRAAPGRRAVGLRQVDGMLHGS
jgi:hypothetical protein